MITSKSDPVFGCVYKLAAIEDENGNIIPKIKVSENASKITTPHFKKVYRLYDNDSGEAFADVMCLYDEEIDESKPIELFDPENTWKKKYFTNFTAKSILEPIFRNGELVYRVPTIDEARAYCDEQIRHLWEEVKRF